MTVEDKLLADAERLAASIQVRTASQLTIDMAENCVRTLVNGVLQLNHSPRWQRKCLHAGTVIVAVADVQLQCVLQPQRAASVSLKHEGAELCRYQHTALQLHTYCPGQSFRVCLTDCCLLCAVCRQQLKPVNSSCEMTGTSSGGCCKASSMDNAD